MVPIDFESSCRIVFHSALPVRDDPIEGDIRPHVIMNAIVRFRKNSSRDSDIQQYSLWSVHGNTGQLIR